MRVGRRQGCDPSPRPYLHRHESHTHGDEIEQDARSSRGDCRQGRRIRQGIGMRRYRIQSGGRRTIRSRISVSHFGGSHCGRRDHAEHSRYYRLEHAVGIRRLDRSASRQRPRCRNCRIFHPLSERFGFGHGEFPRGGQERSKAVGVHHQRYRREGGQREPGRDRDGVGVEGGYALWWESGERQIEDGDQPGVHHPDLQARRRIHGYEMSTPQGHRGSERLSARIGHSPGRHDQEQEDVRNHDSRIDRTHERRRSIRRRYCSGEALGT
mmetsp:Transcript_49423/g.148911  ORF Transcript_49423/g.148911 Transcript_49423/m.148911 type:complete len:268 (-) Transcript_49423:872-1675(-)